MKQTLLLIFTIFSVTTQAQTYSGGGGAIPDAGPQVAFPITVSGLSPATVDTVFGVETICLNITHTWDADLNILLQAPDGTIVDLSVGNGGSGDNYTNTCFNGFATTPIVAGTAPFTGTFRPQGFLGAVNNGQNGNGQWKLLIQDTYAADAGTLLNWSITFGNNPAKPFLFTSSNLPIVLINTFGASIPDEPKIAAQMGIIYNGVGVRNYLTDAPNNYNNKIGIEMRGSSSMSFPQKSYGLETRDINGTQKDTMVLGMPKEHDWILYAPYDDKTCMRNVLSYDIANKTGHYASRTVFCELFINGQYQGIYVMMEKIKRDNNRVDIAKLKPTDISGDDLTGGYIIKVDKQTGSGGSGGWNSNFTSSTGSNIFFQYHYPKDVDIVIQQKNYIQAYVDSFEVALNGPNFADPAIGFRKFADVNSFVDYFILNEISRNVDGYRLSTYLHKDKNSNGGKLKIGPAWDYNLAWWNANYCNGNLSTGWAYQFNSVCGGDSWQVPFWWTRMMQDTEFKNQLKCRWTQLRQTTLNTTLLSNFIDSVALFLGESQQRHFTAWPILGVYTWPNPSPIPADYAGEIMAMKTWMINRVNWLDANMPGTCTVGIVENSDFEKSFYVYPNPFTNTIKLSFYLPENEKASIRIVDMLGRTVYEEQTKTYLKGDNSVEINLDAQSIEKGIYFISYTSNGNTVSKKIVKD
jgi:subtilisin-like proprotein convertase family protein